MRNMEFLVGSNAPFPTDLPTAIKDLEDRSTIFRSRWLIRDHDRAGQVSREALKLLDYIANTLLRERDERKGLATYDGSSFRERMNINCGRGVTGVQLDAQQAMVEAGPGNGRISNTIGACSGLTLERLLNKIKHRNPHLMNFRLENDRHIFLICPEKVGGGAEGIYEFDVAKFCEDCRAASVEL